MNDKVREAAQLLREAEKSRVPCGPVRNLIGVDDLITAYAVQEINTNLRIEAGGRVVGSKIGLTSPAVQKQLGVDQPDFGLLWEDTEVLNGGDVSMQELMQPKVEAEIAFVLGNDLDGENLTEEAVVDAIAYALPSIEIVGSRIADWNIKITDTIADNASASHWVIGDVPVKLDAIDLVNCRMTLENNGVVVSEGTGKDCMGSPIIAVLWLAQKMVDIGNPMRAGDLILSGALGPMSPAKAGDNIKVSIEGLGEVGLSFTE